MKLREMTRVNYKDSHTNTKRATETTTRAYTTTTRRGKKPGTSVKGRKAAKPSVATQRRTSTGRMAKVAATTPKRGPGRPPKRGFGRPSAPAASTAPKSLSRVAPESSSRRAAKREYRAPSPIVKIFQKSAVPSASAAQSNDGNAEHPTSLMLKFFKAHESDVGHIPKKRQRKALGKMWRESSVNPKNARSTKMEPELSGTEMEPKSPGTEMEPRSSGTEMEPESSDAVDCNKAASQADETEEA